jgi:hypothetical protein
MSDHEEVKRMPLWRHFVETHHEAGKLEFGSFFSAEQMEAHLGCRYDSLEFAMAIYAIRKALRRLGGKVFTERGQQGKGFIIAPVERNADEMARLQRTAMNSMREGVILGTNTPVELLDAESRRRHEAILERMATRLALLRRRTLPASAMTKAKVPALQ